MRPHELTYSPSRWGSLLEQFLDLCESLLNFFCAVLQVLECCVLCKGYKLLVRDLCHHGRLHCCSQLLHHCLYLLTLGDVDCLIRFSCLEIDDGQTSSFRCRGIANITEDLWTIHWSWLASQMLLHRSEEACDLGCRELLAGCGLEHAVSENLVGVFHVVNGKAQESLCCCPSSSLPM